MTVLTTFPDVEAVVCDGLTGSTGVDYGDGGYGMGSFGAGAGGVTNLAAGTIVPADLQTLLVSNGVYARVLATGGRDDKTTDITRLTIDTFALTRATAKHVAEQIRAWITADGGQHVGSVVLDYGTTETKPVEVPWNPTVRRFVASYSVSARRSA